MHFLATNFLLSHIFTHSSVYSYVLVPLVHFIIVLDNARPRQRVRSCYAWLRRAVGRVDLFDFVLINLMKSPNANNGVLRRCVDSSLPSEVLNN